MRVRQWTSLRAIAGLVLFLLALAAFAATGAEGKPAGHAKRSHSAHHGKSRSASKHHKRHTHRKHGKRRRHAVHHKHARHHRHACSRRHHAKRCRKVARARRHPCRTARCRAKTAEQHRRRPVSARAPRPARPASSSAPVSDRDPSGPAPSRGADPAPSGGSTSAGTPQPPARSLAGWQGFGATNLPGASWRPYSDDSPFNRPVGNDAVHPRSAQMVSRVLQWGQPGNLVAGTAGTRNDWSHPVYFSQPDDPIFTLHAVERWGRNAMEGMRIPIPDAAQPAAGGDGHMTVVTPDGWEYDMWQVQSKPAGGGTLSFSWGGRIRVDGDGLNSDATAARFGNLAGMIRPEELAAGHIDHALFIVLKCASGSMDFGYGEKAATDSGSNYVYPASKGGARCSDDDTDVPPLGARFALAMSDAQIDALSVPRWKKTILTALAHYGGYVGDTGGPGFGLMFQSGATYTSFGQEDRLVSFARANNVPTWQGDYVFKMADGVDWARYLRVLVPPTS